MVKPEMNAMYVEALVIAPTLVLSVGTQHTMCSSSSNHSSNNCRCQVGHQQPAQLAQETASQMLEVSISSHISRPDHKLLLQKVIRVKVAGKVLGQLRLSKPWTKSMLKIGCLE